MKRFFKVLIIIGGVFMGLFVLMMLGVAVFTSNKPRPVAPESAANRSAAQKAAPAVERPNLEVLGAIECGGSDTMTTVKGRVRNNTGKTYTYAQVTYSLLNRSKEKVGTALANINHLAPGQVWKFEANGFASDVQTCQFSDLTGF